MWRKYLTGLLLLFLLLANVVAFNHAYRFTHFSSPGGTRSTRPETWTVKQKLRTLLLGVNNPRPMNRQQPEFPFAEVMIPGERKLHGWFIPASHSKGTVVLFHGYNGEKSGLLGKAEIFRQLGYATLLVDFRGTGLSEGNATTIGFHEAKDVLACYRYLRPKTGRLFLFGTSMGAVAILKALKDYRLKPDGIILECPFGTMAQTVKARFRVLGVPPFPLAHFLMFWGGLQNNFWAFGHNPEAYARAVSSPALLLYGERDERVSRAEISAVFSNLKGPKYLKTYPQAGHENYLVLYRQAWQHDVAAFLSRY